MFPNGYKYRKKIKVASSGVTGAHSNFQMFLNHSDSDLRDVSNGGKLENNTFRDIRFELIDGTKLDHEEITYDSTSGSYLCWVRVPTLTSNTEFYMYYGKSLSSPEDNPSGVWTGWDNVIHMNSNLDPSKGADLARATGATSLSLANRTPMMSGYNFDGVNDYVTMGRNFQWSRPFSISLWFKPDNNLPSSYGTLFTNGNGNTNYTDAQIGYHSSGGINTRTGNNTSGGSSGRNSFTTSSTFDSTVWRKLDVEFIGYNNVNVYVNGVLRSGSYSGSASNLVYSTSHARMGWNYVSGQYFDGRIAEFKARNGSLPSSSFLLTEYNNQSDVSNFYSIEAEEIGSRVKVWDGSSFSAKTLKVYDGSNWVEKPLKRWDGSSWTN